MIYSFLWLTIFGGAAIKTERLAASVDLCCPNWNSTVLTWDSDMVGSLSSVHSIQLIDRWIISMNVV